MSDWKPQGYNSVSPYLIVSDARATMAFLQAAFDAEPLRVIARPDGTLRHAEARIGDTVVMLADAVDGWPAVPAYVHVYVADVDDSLSAGACCGRRVGRRARKERRCRQAWRRSGSWGNHVVAGDASRVGRGTDSAK